jgi:hypothetical protein
MNNNTKAEVRAHIEELAAELIRVGLKHDDHEYLFLGNMIMTGLGAARDEQRRGELSSVLMRWTVRQLRRANGESDDQIAISELIWSVGSN